jgi:hypothetical protein
VPAVIRPDDQRTGFVRLVDPDLFDAANRALGGLDKESFGVPEPRASLGKRGHFALKVSLARRERRGT